MKKERITKKRARYWYELLPWAFLLVALPVSYFVWDSERTFEFNTKGHVFQSQLNETSARVASQIAKYQQALYSMRSLFDSSEFVSEHEFKLFVDDLLNSNVAFGLRQVGFIQYVNAKQKSAYAPVTYLASTKAHAHFKSAANAFDYPSLKRAMELSAQYNKAVMTESVGFYQFADVDYTFVLPIYSRLDIHRDKTIDVDKQDVYGWVFVDLDIRAILSAVLTGAEETQIRYALSQNSSLSSTTLLYENMSLPDQDSAFNERKLIELSGQNWSLSAQSLPAFESSLNAISSRANKVGLVALLITIAVTSILYLLVARLRTFDALKRANRKLKLSDERWRFAMEGSGDGIWDWNIEEDDVDYSKRWLEIFGYQAEDVQGTLVEWESILHPDDRPLVVTALNDYLYGESGHYSLEYRLRCKDGSWKWILSRGMVVARSEKGKPLRMVGTHTDISQLKESEEQIWQHANFDHLTGLPNRRMLYARLEREIEKCKKTNTYLALLFLDLDGFKEINDSLGHDQGDVLLQQAGKRLTDCTHAQDVVARLGGDEFIILIPSIDDDALKHLEMIAQKVLTTIAEPFDLKHEKAFVSASMGIAIHPEDAGTIDELMKCVDQAMYESKSRGGNCFTYFTPQMQEKALNRLRLSNDLRSALTNNELSIEYQPIIELRTGDIYKAEALLRWQHPDRGWVSPVEFIPLAEDTRQINEIGNWVFAQSIQQCQRWRETVDPRFQIAVNKSPVQFMSTDSAHSAWMSALSKTPEQGGEVAIEITESILLESTGQVGSKLQEYRKKGVQIALDDFGTGYSSLSYLRRFEIDYLKIDKSFIANLEYSAEDRVLCNAIIAMAHSLGIQVVAEGIENQQQYEILLGAGCNFGQGFYFSKSLPPAEFEAYAKRKTVVSLVD